MLQHHYEELTYIKNKLKDYVRFYGVRQPTLLKEITSLMTQGLEEKRCHRCSETLESDGTWYCGECYWQVQQSKDEPDIPESGTTEVIDYADSLC